MHQVQGLQQTEVPAQALIQGFDAVVADVEVQKSCVSIEWVWGSRSHSVVRQIQGGDVDGKILRDQAQAEVAAVCSAVLHAAGNLL